MELYRTLQTIFIYDVIDAALVEYRIAFSCILYWLFARILVKFIVNLFKLLYYNEHVCY